MNTNDKNNSEQLRLQRIEYAYQKFSKTLIKEVRKHYHADQHIAEDIVQTTFERVLRYGYNFASYDDKVAFRFLYTIMRHEAFHLLEKQQNYLCTDEIEEILNKISLSAIDSGNNPELLYVERTIVSEAVKNLPPNYASVLYLHYYHGYKFKEIADFLGISENTAIQRNYYIRQKLKKILIKEGFRDETDK